MSKIKNILKIAICSFLNLLKLSLLRDQFFWSNLLNSFLGGFSTFYAESGFPYLNTVEYIYML